MLFKNEVVLVTGSTRGIGHEIARAFVKEGAVVVILGRNPETAEKVAAEFRKNNGKAESFGCDVTNTQNVQEIVNKLLDKHKKVDILINNAGITRDNLLLRMSESDWDDVIQNNLRGVFNCTKVVLKAMLKARKGKIINIASVIGMTGNIGQANYAASKAGIIGFSKSVALEVASRGITVNAVAPGYIQTAMTAKLNEKAQEGILKSIPLGRFGSPCDVAGVCLFLASRDADYITGQTITVDGGIAI